MGKARLRTTFTAMITSEVILGTTESTMDAAKSLASSQDFLLVSADEQTRGKGTRGRAWRSLPGNVYMTLGINRKYLPPHRLALFPLEFGVQVWEEAAARIPVANRMRLHLKWPNDLMYGDAKVAGILMESHGAFLLIGLGVNVAGAPEITDGGGPSACLADAGMDPAAKPDFIQGVYRRVKEALAIKAGTESGADSDDVLLRWQGKVDWDRTYRLRDREAQPLVQPVSVNGQGHLQVRHADGSHEWLVADYLV